MKWFLAASLLATAAAATATEQDTFLDLAQLETVDAVTPAGAGPGRTGTTVCGCDERRILVDFSRYNAGDYLTELLDGRVAIQASGTTDNAGRDLFYTPNGAARILDSSNPGPDLDLGSPNSGCGGPGNGAGGSPQKANGTINKSDNCVPQGNLLIVQRTDKPTPDSAEAGGVITLTPSRNVDMRLASMGILDVRTNEQVEIKTRNKIDNQQAATVFTGNGQNGFQYVNIVKPIRYYRNIEINMPGGSGISWFIFCQRDENGGRQEGARQLLRGGGNDEAVADLE